MQLIDNLPTQLSNGSTAHLLAQLEDIAAKIELKPDFTLHHPDYQPPTITPEMVKRIGQLPAKMQSQFLTLQLRGFLYSAYYNGSQQQTSDPAEVTQLQNLENTTFLGVDLSFYDRLHTRNTGIGYFDPGWQVIRAESDGKLAVKKIELTLHIDPQRHLPPSTPTPNIGDVIAIRLPKNLFQNGFYMAVGNAGREHLGADNTYPQLVRIYFHLTPEGAVAVMGALTQQLNDLDIPFAFKALYNPSDYRRYDCAVLYFAKPNYTAVYPVLQSIYSEHQEHFLREVPLFTKLLAPGLALAEEPNQMLSAQESFGLNRCQIVANGLMAAWQKNEKSLNRIVESILKQFAYLQLNWQRPYLNPKSEDIYTVLDV